MKVLLNSFEKKNSDLFRKQTNNIEAFRQSKTINQHQILHPANKVAELSFIDPKVIEELVVYKFKLKQTFICFHFY